MSFKPEDRFKKMIWRQSLLTSRPLEQFTSWTIGGTAAIAAVLIENLESIEKLVALGGAKASFIMLGLSLVVGSISKFLGIAVAAGSDSLATTDKLLEESTTQELMESMSVAPEVLVRELAQPFTWPLSSFILGTSRKTNLDPNLSEKRFIRRFCWQIYTSLAHLTLTAAALVVIGFSL